MCACSLEEEWHNHVSDIIIGELKVISLELSECDLSSLV